MLLIKTIYSQSITGSYRRTLTSRIHCAIRWHTNRRNRLAERDRLPQFQQRNIIIVRIRIEIPMPNDCAHRSHNRRRFGRNKLIVVTKNNPNLRSFESENDWTRLCKYWRIIIA